MTRKSLATVAALALAGTSLAGCATKSTDATPATSGGTAAGGGTVRVLIGADTNIQELWEKTIKPGFEKANPGTTVAITLDLHEEHGAQNLAKLTAAVEGNNDSGMDLIDAGIVTQASAAGVLFEADKTSVTGLDGVPDDIIKAGGKGTIPYRGSSVLLAYNPEMVASPPATLDDLLAWIKANPGKFTYNSPKSGGSGGSFVTTVLDKFVPEDAQAKMKNGPAKDMEVHWAKGWETLKGLNPYVYQKGVYPNGNQGTLDLLSGGQIAMCPVWSDMFISGQKNGKIPAKMKVTQISNPSFTGGAAYLGIPKNAKNKDIAIKLANYVLNADTQNAIATNIAGFPVIPLSKLPQATQDIFKAAHPEILRRPYFDAIDKDKNLAWDQQVPGK